MTTADIIRKVVELERKIELERCAIKDLRDIARLELKVSPKDFNELVREALANSNLPMLQRENQRRGRTKNAQG